MLSYVRVISALNIFQFKFQRGVLTSSLLYIEVEIRAINVRVSSSVSRHDQHKHPKMRENMKIYTINSVVFIAADNSPLATNEESTTLVS